MFELSRVSINAKMEVHVYKEISQMGISNLTAYQGFTIHITYLVTEHGADKSFMLCAAQIFFQ